MIVVTSEVDIVLFFGEGNKLNASAIKKTKLVFIPNMGNLIYSMHFKIAICRPKL